LWIYEREVAINGGSKGAAQRLAPTAAFVCQRWALMRCQVCGQSDWVTCQSKVGGKVQTPNMVVRVAMHQSLLRLGQCRKCIALAFRVMRMNTF
jgi:hypothetical protein